MRVVYKYAAPLAFGGDIGIARRLVSGTNPIIRHVESVNHNVMVWIEHDTEGESELTIQFVPTGRRFETRLPFLTTVLMYEGSLVYHVYGAVS